MGKDARVQFKSKPQPDANEILRSPTRSHASKHRDNPLPQLPSPRVGVSFQRLGIAADDVIPMLV